MNIERNSRHINYIWVLSWAINYKHKVEKLKKRLFRTLTTCLLHNDQWEHFHIGNNWIPVSRKTVVRSLRANSKAFTFPHFLANLQRFSLFFFFFFFWQVILLSIFSTSHFQDHPAIFHFPVQNVFLSSLFYGATRWWAFQHVINQFLCHLIC